MSHLQEPPRAEGNLSLEVHATALQGIDDVTARIVLEHSKSLKVESCSIH